MRNKLASEVIENGAITINTIRQNSHRASETFDMGLTFDCDVIGITKGAYQYKIDEDLFVAKAGQLFFVPRGCRFSGMALEDSAHYFCHFTMENLQFSGKNICQEPEAVQLFLRGCADGGDIFLLKCAIRVLLYHLSKHAQWVDTEEIPKGIRKAVEQIRKNPRMNLSGGELAEIAGMNYSYFSRRFSEIMGISPSEYRDNIRLEEAKRLILQGMGVRETAELMGYSDMFAFSKKFKKHFQVSPSKLKNINV